MGTIKLTLRTRIYLTMLALILISFVVTGITAFYNFKNQNEDYNSKRFDRKEGAIQESMQYFLYQKGGFIDKDSVVVAFSDKICELSDVHNMSISLYDLKGNLLIAASPSEEQEGDTLDVIAYETMKSLSTGKTRAVKTNTEGDNPAILAYWYFSDIEDKPIAITNVRYIKTRVDREEITSFLIQLTKIYIALFVGAAILAYVLSNYITKSLQQVGKKMQGIRLNQKNEPLEWGSDDEIGALVKEYNRMLSEVETSAERLARSERESAWREMAKQVAHEIKNPLTPMKLRIQHLERAWQDGVPNFDEKMKVSTASLIEQIDTLTNIANEFSHFAKMPKAQLEEVNLDQVLQATVALFQPTESIHIEYECHSDHDVNVLADKDQIIRVFNNLITNAIQAIPETQEGRIQISLKEEDGKAIVEVRDNGVGISNDEKDKIFVPNFTTKTTGTGLGLAMVKNIIENAEGEVWFESTKSVGSSFFAAFPLILTK